MEVVTMEKKAFDLMMARYDALVKKVELLKHKANGKRLNKWLTGHEVCQQLRISQRTLQKLRDRRFLGHTQIGRQFYYCPKRSKPSFRLSPESNRYSIRPNSPKAKPKTLPWASQHILYSPLNPNCKQ